MPQTISVQILNGEVKVTTKGFAGKSCQQATADLERALGKTTKDTPTAEASKPTTVKAGL